MSGLIPKEYLEQVVRRCNGCGLAGQWPRLWYYVYVATGLISSGFFLAVAAFSSDDAGGIKNSKYWETN
jgi:hypothetical protein